MELNWLQSIASGWQARVSQCRLPHAVLLLGPAGTGKRATAAWIARQRLNMPPGPPLPEYPLDVPQHADMRWLTPPEDKHSIGVDQIRQLVHEFSLTSYEGGGKVAVIDPANAMTANAANSLLKTLEEPAGDALLVLVADRVGRLPATIFSRCQRINFNRPAESASLEWLDALQPGADWRQALQASGGSPLGAIEALERLAETDVMAREFADIAAGSGAHLEIAARWARQDPAFVLDWLSGHVQQLIQQMFGGFAAGADMSIPHSVLRRIDRRNLFCYLDIINRLRGQAAGSYNVQLTLEGLLIDWANGLTGIKAPGSVETAKMAFLNG